MNAPPDLVDEFVYQLEVELGRSKHTVEAYQRDVNRFVIQAVPVSNLFFYGPDGDIPSTVTIGPSSPFYPTALAESR